MKPVNWKVFLYTSIGVLLVFSTMTTMDVALPTIVRALNASPSQGNWILLSYMLTNTIMILAFGRLADLFGRKALYLLGIAIFTVGSLLSGLAWSANALIAFRIVQAIGAASVVTNTTALLVDAYPAERMALVLGLNVSVAAGSSICGPLIGGALVSLLGWRALFLSAVPLGAFSLVAGFRVLTMRAERSNETFDYAGAILSFVALGCLVLALSEGGTLGWTSSIIVGCFAVSAVSWVAFVRTQLATRHPLVDLSILRSPDLVLSYYANFMMAVVQMATLLLVSLFLQAVFGMDALAAGAHITALAAGLMAGTACSAQLIDRVAPRHVAAVGMGLIAAASLALSAQFSGAVNVLEVSGLMGLIGLGVGLFMTPNTTSIMSSVSPERRGIANGVRSMVQNMGFVVGTALSLAIVTSPLTEGARRAVYTGQSHLLEPTQLELFHGQYLFAFRILTCVAVSAVVACVCRLKPRLDPKLST